MMRIDRAVSSTICLLLSLLFIPVFPVHGFDYGDINPDYLPPSPWPVVEYKDPGDWTTIDVSEHGLKPDTDVDAAVAIAKIIADTEGRRRLFFPAGTYTLKSSLRIRVGDIWLDGEGKETRFVLDFEEGKEYNGIIFKGYIEDPVSLAGAPKRGDESVHLTQVTDLKVGELVQVYHDVKENRGYGFPRGQMSWITALDGKTATLDLKIGADLSGDCKLRRINALRNVRCTNFAITRKRKGPMGDQNLLLEYCANAEIRNVESSYATTYCIRMIACRDVLVTGCVVHDYWTKKGHNGYGIHAEKSSGINIVANRAYNLRHHYELSWGTSYSVLAYNVAEPAFDYCDVGSHHGDIGYCNLFEGNKCSEATFDYGESNWNAYNFFYRNQAARQVGSFRPKRSKRYYMAIVANETPGIGTQSVVEPYVAANIVKGEIQWGDLSEGSHLPASLFLKEKPDYLEDQAWPLFGPPVGKSENEVQPEEEDPMPEGLDAEQVSPRLQPAVRSLSRQRYATVLRMIERIEKINLTENESPDADTEVLTAEREQIQLVRAFIDSKVNAALEQINAYAEAKNVYRAHELINESNRYFRGIERYDDNVADLQKMLRQRENLTAIRQGARFYELLANAQRRRDARALEQLDAFAKAEGDTVYGKAAGAAVAAMKDDPDIVLDADTVVKQQQETIGE